MKKAAIGRLFHVPVRGLMHRHLFGLSRFLLPWSKRKLLASFLRQGIAILVLNHAVKVEVRDALTDARFPNMQVRVFFDALPKIALQHCKTNVALVLDLVLVNDVENHVVVFVQVVHGAGVGL